MASAGRDANQDVGWVIPPCLSNQNLSRVIDIDWINWYVNITNLFNYYFIFSRTLPYNETLHLFNSKNENRPVKVGFDGQVVEIYIIYKILFSILLYFISEGN
jgi:hypothetical protein